MLWNAILNMPANLENATVATGLEKICFHSKPKEKPCQRMFQLLPHCTLSHSTKYLKFSKPSFNSTWTVNFQTFKLDLEKEENQGSNCQQPLDHPKNIYFCFIDYTKDFDGVDHKQLWKILKEIWIPDHLTCLLRNLYAGQEARVRTGHGTADWFQIGKGVYIVTLLI